ncbi:MAG: DNA double-strand break repair nuclease NurA [Candidatus Bathyarchaeia archaeon]
MVEDVFLPDYLDALSRVGGFGSLFDESFRDAYLAFWRGFSVRCDEAPYFAVADGSRASTTFRGGVRAVCVRAIANVYDGKSLVASIPVVDVRVGHRLRRPSLYMRALEFKCLKSALEDFPKVSMAICDGDLYPLIHPVIVRITTQEVEAYVEYLRALYDLYEFTKHRGILLIGITKDSFVNYLRARILAAYVSKENPVLGQALARERSLRRIERVLASIKDQTEKVKLYLSEAGRATSDEEVFDEYTSDPGFSKPLVLAPQPIYLSEEIKAGTKSWRGSRIRRRLSLRGPPFSDVAEFLDRLYTLPPVVLSYWRPWHKIGVYRVDVGGWCLGVNEQWNDVESDYFLSEDRLDACERIFSILNGLSPEPFTVKPLLDADDLVRFDTKTYRECYEPLLIEALRKAEFKALLTKRDIRELMVRV